MTEYLVLQDFGRSATRYRAGSILDDAKVNVASLQAQGLAAVEASDDVKAAAAVGLAAVAKTAPANIPPSLAAYLTAQGLFGGGGGFDIELLFDPATSGVVLEGSKHYQIFVTAPAGDIVFTLPPAADNVGKPIRVSLNGSTGDHVRFGVLPQGTDLIGAEVTAGPPATAAGPPIKYGNLDDFAEIIEFTAFIIPAGIFGPSAVPLWGAFHVHGGYNSMATGKVPAALATTSALDVGGAGFTASGSGPDETLTMDNTGVLTIDGVALTTADVYASNGVVVANEADKTKHGIYQVREPGDGGTQAVLRRRADFAYAGHLVNGNAFVPILYGAANAGKIYTAQRPTGGGLPTPGVTAFDWVTT